MGKVKHIIIKSTHPDWLIHTPKYNVSVGVIDGPNVHIGVADTEEDADALMVMAKKWCDENR